MILQWIKIGLMTLALGGVLAGAGGAEPLEPVSLNRYHLDTSRGTVAVEETRTDTLQTSVRRRSYTIYNGDAVIFGSAKARTGLDETCVAELEIPAATGTLRWYDAAKSSWESCDIETTTVEAGCVVIATRGGDALLYTPKVYEPMGSGTLRREPEIAGSVRLLVEDGKCRVQLWCARIPKGHQAEFAVVQSAGELANWRAPSVREAWASCTMDNDRLWCYDGCYHPSPSNYIPTGENCYYRVPAAYFTRLVADNAPDIRAAEDLTVAMLDVICKQQNEAGFFPTLPTSEWLQEDYGLGGGFYDTRFNSDLAEIFSGVAGWLECPSFYNAMNRYFDYYQGFASACRTPTENGVFVWDYYAPGGGSMTHTSLNHQVAELLALCHWAEHSGRDELQTLADRMIRAVEDTVERWICDDGNLHYAVYPGDSYGGQDYPYLTYNDLYDLRAYLQSQDRDTSRIQLLMDAKLRWMQANGVTNHK